MQSQMIQDPSYHQQQKHQNYVQYDEIIESDCEIDSALKLSKELKSQINKKSSNTKFIKQLKSKNSWMKYIHKKIPFFPNNPNHNIKHNFSLSTQKPSITDDNLIQSQLIHNSDTKKDLTKNINKPKQKIKNTEKSINHTSIFNPELFTFSREQMKQSHEKYNKKFKVSEISNLQHRVRESRSQSKGEKPILHENLTKSTLNTYENNPNIFQNINLLAKHNSYHSLDKNQPIGLGRASNTLVNSKIEEKLHLPSLIRHSQLKNKNKVQTISLLHENNETQIQKSPFYNESAVKTQKSSPFIQKMIKIPLDRLKPLRPEEIKLKFHQKVKQQQKNRAKQRAIQIFQKQQKQSSIKKELINLGYQSQSEESSTLKNDTKKMYYQEIDKIRSRNSVHQKKQKNLVNTKVENIFKSIDFRQKLM